MVILWFCFVVVVLAELFILYQYLYLNFQTRDIQSDSISQPIFRIDHSSLTEAEAWLKKTENYKLPDNQFQQQNIGRENPFAEY